jgi:antitoxin component HigA of HigAB toxin-antitoxin module
MKVMLAMAPLNVLVGGPAQGSGPVDWLRPEMRSALTRRDVSAIYRQLQKIGYSQKKISGLTSQEQPEASAILHGRKVMAYDVLHRVVVGLGAPLCMAGMGGCCTCCGHQLLHAATESLATDSMWLQHPMRLALAARDITGLYRELQAIGFRQNHIAELAYQSRGEVWAILKGRRVMAYDVIRRIIEGVAAPLCIAGLRDCCACCGHSPTGDV